MSGQYYQQPPPAEQQPYTQPYAPQGNKGIETHFIAKDKIGLSLFLCAGMVLVGFLLLDLIASGLVRSEEAIIFLGLLAVDAGIIAFISLLLVSGVCRDDLSEVIRNRVILVSGMIMVMFLIVYISRALLL